MKAIIIRGAKIVGGLIAVLFLLGLILPAAPKSEDQKNTPLQSQEQGAEVANATANQEAQVKAADQAVAQGGAASTAVQKPIGDLYKVVDVVDGDTIKVSINGSVKTLRLIGMDTPETVDPRKPVQCFGREASNKTKELLLNKSVRLEADSTQGELDKYQRTLRYVFMEDGTFFNKWMIENGYAHEYTYNTAYKYQAEFKAAEKSARDANRGLWNTATCPATQTTQVAPVKTQTAQPTTVPNQTMGGHIFYTSSHSSAKLYYCDTDEAWKNLTPSYLKSFASEAELLSRYKRTLHEPCK